MQYTISKEFSCDAAHRLHLMEQTHCCRNIHGHTYTISVVISTRELDDKGMVIDFRKLDVVKKYVDEKFDHTLLISQGDKELIEIAEKLNTRHTVLPVLQTTCEEMGKYLYTRFFEQFQDLIPGFEYKYKLCVTISETPKTKSITQNK